MPWSGMSAKMRSHEALDHATLTELRRALWDGNYYGTVNSRLRKVSIGCATKDGLESRAAAGRIFLSREVDQTNLLRRHRRQDPKTPV
jgi:hypothetical protein